MDTQKHDVFILVIKTYLYWVATLMSKLMSCHVTESSISPVTAAIKIDSKESSGVSEGRSGGRIVRELRYKMMTIKIQNCSCQ